LVQLDPTMKVKKEYHTLPDRPRQVK
jgi:hypothetical protein